MALMMSADNFPVTATTADCPVLNWAYNFSYIAVNKEVSQYKKVDAQKSPLPIVSVVTEIFKYVRFCDAFSTFCLGDRVDIVTFGGRCLYKIGSDA